MLKRAFDLLVASSLLVALSPLMLCLAILVRVVIGRQVLFKQLRPGLHGKPFYVYKFRTMSNDYDVHGNLLPDANRLSPLGKLLRRFSLDELPQLINVAKGEMSLVGPRPLLMEYLPLYSAEQARRHAVKPGITGWAQVNGRNAISWEERFKLDVWYVDHQSWRLDLRICWLTFLKVLRPEGINQNGQATMTKFLGETGDDHS